MTDFAIHALAVGNGTIALSPMPGRGGAYSHDLAVVHDWQPDLVISMTTTPEMAQNGAEGLGCDLADHDIAWAHLPVQDFGAPLPEIDALWAELSTQADQILSRRGKVLVHCRGGCGRSGMVVLRIMVAHGEAPAAALARLRAVRPCAVETKDQAAWAAQAARLDHISGQSAT
ncbi:protein-tyrosine phosphatase family protein [Ruegeria meonggei]|uniref:protein-tyrosine phosphatase family protein n=1 Tax=Ruegeria meonggei TaxID=1446476 RepID=UPI001F419F35|nr:protein-tyrosine phosphatase family protein [Ruegeria meonggei]